ECLTCISVLCKGALFIRSIFFCTLTFIVEDGALIRHDFVRDAVLCDQLFSHFIVAVQGFLPIEVCPHYLACGILYGRMQMCAYVTKPDMFGCIHLDQLTEVLLSRPGGMCFERIHGFDFDQQFRFPLGESACGVLFIFQSLLHLSSFRTSALWREYVGCI